MKNIKIGRITFAFIFISLGTVIFLEKFLKYKLMYSLYILWPSIIIFFGLEVLYRTFSIKEDDNKSDKLDILSTSFIFLFVITLGFTTTINSQYPNLKKIINTKTEYKYKDNISEEVILKKNKRLIIDDSNIDIIINKSENKDIKVRLEGIYKYNKSQNFNNKLKLIEVNDSNGVTEIGRYTKSESRSIKKLKVEDMRYLIYLPEGIDIDIINGYGNIDIEDIKNNININSSYSDISVEDVVGNIDVNTSYGDFDAENIKGSVYVKSTNGDVSLNLKTNENINIYCNYGDVSMKLPKKQVGKFNIIATYGNIYDKLGFNIIESASTSSINEIRKSLNPIINIRVNNGNVILETD